MKFYGPEAEKKIRCSSNYCRMVVLSHHDFDSLIRSPDKERSCVGRVPTSLCGQRKNKTVTLLLKEQEMRAVKGPKIPSLSLSCMVSLLINHIS